MRAGSTLIGGIGGGLAALALAWPAADAVTTLRAARQARVDLTARIADAPRAPGPMVAPGLAVPGGNARAARTALQRRLRELAARGGVLVESVTPVGAGAGLIELRLRASGPAKAVIAFADTIERDAPLARFTRWRATALPGDQLRLEGELAAAWR